MTPSACPQRTTPFKNHIHPAKVTHDNIENFRKQLHMLGYSFDWDREVNTTDPSYYKWTQWIFLQLLQEGAGLQGLHARQLVHQLQDRPGQ